MEQYILMFLKMQNEIYYLNLYLFKLKNFIKSLKKY